MSARNDQAIENGWRPGATPGPSSRESLVVLLAEFWARCDAPIPSAALVAVLAEFGVNEANVRVAAGRLVRQGVIEPSREGRRTYYRISPGTRELMATRGRALMRFGLDWPPWDGRWTCLAFALPGDGKLGPALRAGLRNLRMAPLYDGIWVSPHNMTGPVRTLLGELGVPSATLMRARVTDLDVGGRDPADAWDLSALRQQYAAFTDHARALEARRRRRDLDPTDALIERTRLTLRWRAFAYDDPLLPFELLPSDWPLLSARKAFIAAYDRLGPLAETRVRTVVKPFAMTEAWRPRHHKAADLY